MWPSLSPFGRRTAVPSTRSLAISGCGFSMTLVTIIPSSGLMRRTNVMVAMEFPSGREHLGIPLLEERHRLELVVAGKAMPEIGDTVRAVFNPFRGGDRLAALGAGIALRRLAEVHSGHRGSPFCFCVFAVGELDRMAAGLTHAWSCRGAASGRALSHFDGNEFQRQRICWSHIL